MLTPQRWNSSRSSACFAVWRRTPKLWHMSTSQRTLCRSGLAQTTLTLCEVIGAFVKKRPSTDENCSSVTFQEAYHTVIHNFKPSDMKRVAWRLLLDEA